MSAFYARQRESEEADDLSVLGLLWNDALLT